MQQELGQAKVELKQACEELAQTRTALEAVTTSPVWSSPQPSYADIARTPPESHSSDVMKLSNSRTASASSGDTIYCTIDIHETEDGVNGRVTAKTIRPILETEMRAKPHNGAWRCRAVTEDRSNPQRMRVVCRNENEQGMVKKTIEDKLVTNQNARRAAGEAAQGSDQAAPAGHPIRMPGHVTGSPWITVNQQ
ncbi:hypothetical protein MY4038_008775 [Beauveria bassiana]